MKTFHGLSAVDGSIQACTIAIGVFDGVHRGHQQILTETSRIARSRGIAAVAFTFDIHPAELLAPSRAPLYLASLIRRVEWMDQLGGGIDGVVIARFDPRFASLSPEEFVSEVLLARLRVQAVLVGEDFRYGKGRAGDVHTLAAAGKAHGFDVTVLPPVVWRGARVSSTQIRHLIDLGDIPAATDLLGHSFVIEGQVVEGKKLGRTLGFPTANLQPGFPMQLLPGNGVYAATAILPDGRTFRSAVSIGTNPTTDTDQVRKVEAYLMDGFEGDLYGQTLALDIRGKVRDEVQFESLAALVEQIRRDVGVIGSLEL